MLNRRQAMVAGIGAGLVALAGGLALANAPAIVVQDRWSDTPGLWPEAKPILDEDQAEFLKKLPDGRLMEKISLDTDPNWGDGDLLLTFRVDWMLLRPVPGDMVVDRVGHYTLVASYRDGRLVRQSMGRTSLS